MILWPVLGWAGNICFFSRFLVQWILSERARRSVAPKVFWWLSLCGSILLASYALRADSPVLLVGYVLNGGIYARNLWIQRRMGRVAALGPGPRTLFAAIAGSALVWAGMRQMGSEHELAIAWVVCGALGQAVWSSRFVLQWWFTERSGESHFPPSFWWVSLAGNALLLAFAARLGDPVFIAGFLPGPLVQVRNLMLGARRPRTEAELETAEAR